ncbi:unnamed protein product [Vicia faba]|uniref:Uncharacterized protein n=1 Tax=Vicia faba TaxID=3906 RepID=A0AAV0YY17_VICFA|nr:unnamed protein product [Vicia faba]
MLQGRSSPSISPSQSFAMLLRFCPTSISFDSSPSQSFAMLLRFCPTSISFDSTPSSSRRHLLISITSLLIHHHLRPRSTVRQLRFATRGGSDSPDEIVMRCLLIDEDRDDDDDYAAVKIQLWKRKMEYDEDDEESLIQRLKEFQREE